MIGFRKSHAIVIGIDAYCHGIPPLRTAVNDARRVAQVLEQDFGYAVKLLDENVTLERLRALFGEFLARVGEVDADDRLLVYFAGHGIALDGDDGPAGYLVPQDAHRDDRGSFLPMTELSGWLERLSCRHMLLVLDCCFAGAFRWSSTRDLGALPEVIHRERFDRYIRDPAWQVLTSAAYDQKALDVLSGETIGSRGHDPGQAGHSPFAAALLQALSGEADLIPRARDGRPGGDGVITATELYLYLRECVELGAEHDGQRQTPGLWPLKRHDKGEFIHLVPGHEVNLPPAPVLNEENNPYRGLESYDEKHAPLFFGRSKFVATLADRVRSQTLTVVLGASGTGKSSVVKAGLLPLYHSREPESWRLLPPLRPGKSPLATLAALTLPGEAGDPDAIAGRLVAANSDPEALARRVSDWAAATQATMSPPARLLLVVDQFEELLTLCWNAAERELFLVQIDRALAACPDRLRIVLTLRSDFEPQFADSPLQEKWLASRVVVPPLTLDEYREVIEGPASIRVLYFQGRAGSQSFINRLIGDVASTPGALPLLSFTLSELYRRYLERAGDDRALNEQDYEQLGGVGGSLRHRADEVYHGLPDNLHRETMRRVMLRMVSVEGGELARRRVPEEELVYEDPKENERVREVLRQLTEARLVVAGKEVDEQSFVEPAHDELIRGWNLLLQWSREEAESLQLRRRLTPASVAWSLRRGGLWLVEPRLGVLRQIQRSPENWLNRVEGQFLRRSLAVRRRIAFSSAAALTMAFLVISILGLFANDQRKQALKSLDETEHSLARSFLSPLGTASEVETLWDVATLDNDRVRLLFLQIALEKFTTARQLGSRVDLAVHSAIGLDNELRSKVIDRIVLPTLRSKARSQDPLDFDIRLVCAQIGDCLDAVQLPSGSEFAGLAVDSAVDYIGSSTTPDPRAVITFRRNLARLPRARLKNIRAKLEGLLPEGSSTAAQEYLRDRFIGLMLVTMEKQTGPTETASHATVQSAEPGTRVDRVLAQARRAYQSDKHGPGFLPIRLNPETSDWGPVEFQLAASATDAGVLHDAKSQNGPLSLRMIKPKLNDPTPAQALAAAESIRVEIARPEFNYLDTSPAILGWVVNLNVIAPILPEDVRRELAESILHRLLAKMSKNSAIRAFAEAFVVLSAYLGPNAAYEQLLDVLQASNSSLASWETPGERADRTIVIEKAHNFCLAVLRDPAFGLNQVQYINILKYPLCIGELKKIVLTRLAKRLRPSGAEPFDSEWDLVSWIESRDPRLYEIARQPPMGPPKTAR